MFLHDTPGPGVGTVNHQFTNTASAATTRQDGRVPRQRLASGSDGRTQLTALAGSESNAGGLCSPAAAGARLSASTAPLIAPSAAISDRRLAGDRAASWTVSVTAVTQLATTAGCQSHSDPLPAAPPHPRHTASTRRPRYSYSRLRK